MKILTSWMRSRILVDLMGSSLCCIVGTHEGKCKGRVEHRLGNWSGGITDYFECEKCNTRKFIDDDNKKQKWIKFGKNIEYGGTLRHKRHYCWVAKKWCIPMSKNESRTERAWERWIKLSFIFHE